jgi:triosephosphate isomerase (TIM)
VKASKIIGNWKMNGLQASLEEAAAFSDMVSGLDGVWTAICPPATLIAPMKQRLAGSIVRVGAQTCHHAASGAHTGDLSAAMLAEAGAKLVIVGHSERRADHGETSALVAAQAVSAAAAGLHVVICVGETREQREAGRALEVVLDQLRGSIPQGLHAGSFSVAYEPVWAIGTGLTATIADIAQMHQAIHEALDGRHGAEADSIAILYGGSVKPDNAAAILSVDHVGGALVGGASLKAADLAAIVDAAPRAG